MGTRLVLAALAVWSAALLAGCGGGSQRPVGDPLAQPLRKVAPALCDKGRHDTTTVRYRSVDGVCAAQFAGMPERAVADAASAPTSAAPLRAAHAPFTWSTFLAWATAAYPQFFWGAWQDGAIGEYTYRYFPGTDHYLAITSSQRLYVVGPATDWEILSIGTLTELACFVYPANCAASTQDIRADASTSAAVGVPGQVTSSIDAAGDQDWFAVDLVAGASYTFTLEGASTGRGTLSDPMLRLYSAGGALLTSNDDISYPANLNSQIQYTAPTSGRYYLAAAAYQASGSYTLSVTGTGGTGTGTGGTGTGGTGTGGTGTGGTGTGGTGTGGTGGGSVDWNSSFSAEELIDESPTLAANARQGWTFEITGAEAAMEVIFAAQYTADLFLMPADQVNACVNRGAFNYYPSYSFQGQFGFNAFTLPPGQYGLCLVNRVSQANGTRFEFQRQPQVTGFHFLDSTFATVARTVAAGGRLVQPVTVGDSYRVVVDGANSGGSIYIIPASEQSSFLGGGTFQYYTSIDCSSGRAAPGLCEITATGNQAIAYVNDTGSPQSIVMVGRAYAPD